MVILTKPVPRVQLPCTSNPYHRWELPDGTTWVEFYRSPFGILLRFPGIADFEVATDARSISCFPVPDALATTTEHLYLNQVLPLALSKQGKLVFHGSAVEVPGGAAIAFLAESGRGKSTLAASFAVCGQRFLTDDGLVLQEGKPHYLVQPSHPSLRLRQDSYERLLGGYGKIAPALEYTSKMRLLAGQGLCHCALPKPMLAAHFLGDGSVEDITFRRLTEAESLIEWTKHSFLLDVEDKALIGGHFDRISALANNLPCYHLDYPRRYEDLRRVVESIVFHAKSTVRLPT